MLTYTNKRGKDVPVIVTQHAKTRWLQRYKRAYPDKDGKDPGFTRLQEYFSRATRIEPKTRKYKKRLKRHGKDTLYFKYNDFVFIVQDGTLVTIELGGVLTRQLN